MLLSTAGSLTPSATRRAALESVAFLGSAASAAELVEVTGTTDEKRSRIFLETILPPVWRRATVRYDLGRGAYAFEQLLAFSNVSATIRMNVQRLQDGSLFVIAPVAPTQECLALLNEVGTVSHVVLPVTALEHKAFFSVEIKFTFRYSAT